MATWPFSLIWPGGLVNDDVPTHSDLNKLAEQQAQAANGLVWNDAALIKNITTVTVANRLGPLIYVPADLLGIGSSMFMSFGINGGNPEGSFCVDGRNVWSPLGSMQVGVGLQPLCGDASPSGTIILVGGTPGSNSTQKIRRSSDTGTTWGIANVNAAGGNLASVQTLNWFPAASLWVAGFDTDATGTGGHLETSPDGITWTPPSTSPNDDPRWQAAVSPTAMVITSSASTNKAIRSANGIAWTEVALPSTGAWKAVAWSDQNSCFLALRPGAAAVSSDGTTWSSAGVTAPAQLTTISQIVSLGRMWIAVGSAGGHSAVYYSIDNGGTWQCAHVVINATNQQRTMAVAAGTQLAWKDSVMGHHMTMRSGY
jgi:hypothetical protein